MPKPASTQYFIPVCICKPQTSLTGYTAIARSMRIPKTSTAIHRCSYEPLSAMSQTHFIDEKLLTAAGSCAQGFVTSWRRPTTNMETTPRAAHKHMRMFGSSIFSVEADSRRKNKQTLSLLENIAIVYKRSPVNISYTLSDQIA